MPGRVGRWMSVEFWWALLVVAGVPALIAGAAGLPVAGVAGEALIATSGALIAFGVLWRGRRRARSRRLRWRGGSDGLRARAERGLGSLVRSGAGVDLAIGRVDGPEAEVCAIGALDGSSVIEAGSLTKIVTGLLLCDLVLGGVVALEQTAGALLSLPRLADVTLEDLAVHRSGLPRIPRTLAIRALLRHPDPYAGCSLEWLRAHSPEPGRKRPLYSSPRLCPQRDDRAR